MTTSQRAPHDTVDTTGMAPQPRHVPPDPELLSRHASRILDPSTVPRFAEQSLRPTVYGGSRLLVRPTAREEDVLAWLAEVADHFDLDIDVNQVDNRLRELARDAGIEPDDPQPLLIRVQLLPRPDNGLLRPPDAWPVLQEFRARYPAAAHAVQLDHVLSSHDGIIGTPYWHVPGTTGTPYWHVPGTTGTPYWHVPGTGNPYLDVPSGVTGYAVPGFGGRAPVAWVGPEPIRQGDSELDGQRRPVIALLDTGISKHHYWLPPDVVIHDVNCAELPIGLTDPATAPEDPSVRLRPLIGELDETAGHGTFCAGLIRQKCPDATILGIRVVQGDGIVAEAELLQALNMLWLRQKLAIAHKRPQDLIDIVSMSLGYYHEEYEDLEFDPLLLAPIQALSQLGVVIIVSSGNDATTRPMFPAAFSPYPDGVVSQVSRGELPVVAVGASNPDHSVALFSNEGPWVQAHRPGAALVSTMPPFDASRSPVVEMQPEATDPTLRKPRPNNVRSTLDPDDFTAGFGVWSGTSFAAPILAGEIAQYFSVHRLLPADELDPDRAVDRGWEAISDRVPTLQRSNAAVSHSGYSADDEASKEK